jgi:hypothetical protein
VEALASVTATDSDVHPSYIMHPFDLLECKSDIPSRILCPLTVM